MAAITSSGAGSGLQVNSLVEQLVAAERAPYDARLTRVDTKLTTEFSALSQLKAAMSSFQSALTTLKAADAFALRKATVSDETAFTATASSTAASGSYDVEVKQLARAAQLGSAPFLAGADAVVGTGTLAISMGTATFNITLDAEHSTLGNIRDAINNAPANPGVRATLIRGVAGSQLVLTGAATGAGKAIKVLASGGNGGLAQIAYDPPGITGLDLIGDPPQDAIVFVSGIEIHSADNSIDEAIDGVTLSLKKADEGTLVSLTVASDDSGIQSRATGFVNAYNVLANQIAKLRSYDAATKAAGPLLGDAMLRNIESQMRRLVSEPVSSGTQPYTTLASLGITSTVTGTLALDSAKFNAALAANPAAAGAVFGSTDGVAKRLDSFLTGHLATTGDLATRDAGITTRRKDLTAQQTALDARMAVIQARYLKQFTALDSLLTQMQSTSSYLATQLNQISSIGNQS